MKFLKIVFIFIFVVSFSLPSFSDCGNLDPCTGDPSEVPGINCCTDITVPFDSGIAILIVAGLGIGAISIYKRRKQLAS